MAVGIFDSRRVHQIYMTIHAIVHRAEEGGYWAEVPSIPGCATQGETMEELRSNLREAIEGCLSVPVDTPASCSDDHVIELVV
jgi:predicted RNase H-like HicB family nuclease